MAFAGLHMLHTMHIMNAGLMSVSPVTPVKSTLDKLFLANNNISVVPPCYFSSFKKLKHLNMNSNSLSLIPDISPVCNTIINLQLSRNNIHSISGGVIKAVYPLFKFLYLEENTINKFNPDMMTFWPFLRVYLPTRYPERRTNQCSGINASVCYVSFDGNQVNCDKAVEEIIIRRQDGYNFAEWNCYVKIDELQRTACASPPQLCGQNLQGLSMYKITTFHVPDPWWGDCIGQRWIPLTKGQWCRALNYLSLGWWICWKCDFRCLTLKRRHLFWYYGDVIKWNHISRYWTLVRGIYRWPVHSLHKGQWRGSLMFSLICALTNGWMNNRDSGDLRRHLAHYDVIVMCPANKGRKQGRGRENRFCIYACVEKGDSVAWCVNVVVFLQLLSEMFAMSCNIWSTSSDILAIGTFCCSGLLVACQGNV